MELKYIYKDFEVCCQREKSLGGDILTYYQIYDKDGMEVVSTFTTDEAKFRKFTNDLREIVDDIVEHPEDYYEE